LVGTGGSLANSVGAHSYRVLQDNPDYASSGMLLDANDLDAVRTEIASTLVGFMPADDFARDHILGSVQTDWPAFELTDTSDASVEQWRDRVSMDLAALGITPDRSTVIYDTGSLFAARLWWVLHYLGHTGHQVINGGLPAWREAAGDSGSATPSMFSEPALAASPYPIEPRTSVLAPFTTVLANLENPDVLIIDARTQNEYIDGHIPGAVNINYPLNALADAPRFWRSADELRSLYEGAGVTQDKLVIPYCSSGVRSAVTFFTLRLIGYDNVALYTGSWNEWSRQPDAPQTVGDQP
jgi:thiosulfate/3-mercaptopyruvate sulfurtransferase